MNHFAQKPVQIRKKSPSPLFASFALFSKIGEKRPKTRQSYRRREEKQRENRRSGFSFSVPSLATLAIAAGTAVIALAALNWEDFSIKRPDIYAFRPADDTGAERRIIEYASTGIPNIFSSIPSGPNEAAAFENGQIPENAENIDTNNPHGSVITFEWQQYRVQRGDSVSSIAQKFGVSVGAIIASNEIRNARRLQEGAVIKIPNIDGIPYQIKRGDSLSRISVSFNVPLEVILDVNDIKSDTIVSGETIFLPGARMNDIDLRLSLGELFAYPLQSRYITSNHGMRRDPISGVLSFHGGLDFRANIGVAVLAALDGVVSYVGENRLYGKHIIISHENGYKTLYGHLSAFSVRRGDRAVRGRKIGEVGNTGYSTGPHLHFGIYDKENKTINPLELLN